MNPPQNRKINLLHRKKRQQISDALIFVLLLTLINHNFQAIRLKTESITEHRNFNMFHVICYIFSFEKVQQITFIHRKKCNILHFSEESSAASVHSVGCHIVINNFSVGLLVLLNMIQEIPYIFVTEFEGCSII